MLMNKHTTGSCRWCAPFVALFLAVMYFTSCASGDGPSGVQNHIADDGTAPRYLKEVLPIFNKQGISMRYEPQTLASLPVPTKEYEIPAREIPDAWVASQLEWHIGTSEEQKKNPVLFSGFCCDSCDYLLESAIDPTYTPPSSSPGAQFPYKTKQILKLYKRKNMGSQLPGTLTNADHELVTTLDGVTEQGRAPQNQLVNSSARFLVWNAFADEFGERWTIWSYDVAKSKAVAIYSYEDAADIGTTTLTSSIVPEKDLFILDAQIATPTGTPKHRLIFYDLVQGKVVKTLDEPASKGFLVVRQWGKVHAVGDYIYMERQQSGTSSSTAEIVRLNLATWKEETVIQVSPFHIMASSPDGLLALVPYQEDYQYHDVWVRDTTGNTMTCPFRVQLSPAEPGEQSSSPAPYLSLCPAGVFYVNNSPSIDAQRATFYSLVEKKAYITGPCINTNIDGQGSFLVLKSLGDMYLQSPPFDYPGKARKLAGYETFLIVKPTELAP